MSFTSVRCAISWVYAFGGHETLLTIDPDTVLALSTEDCFDALVRGGGPDQSGLYVPRPHPVTGPMPRRWTEGDAFAVHVVDIRPARARGRLLDVPTLGR